MLRLGTDAASMTSHQKELFAGYASNFKVGCEFQTTRDHVHYKRYQATAIHADVV